MNLIELKEPPKDIETYIQARERFQFDEFVVNPRALIKEGRTNIEIEDCSFTIIDDLADLINENGYTVQFMPIGSIGTHAHFFLERPRLAGN